MNDPMETQNRGWRTAGAVVQGVILGLLLSVAVVELWATGANVRLFQYQNF